MPRQRYRQNPLPVGPDAPPAELFGPEQPNPPGLQVAEQGQYVEALRLCGGEGRNPWPSG
jgi:hypothetical protein